MNFWTYVHLFCLAAYTAGFFYVIIKNPYAVLNWVLAMLFFCFALWSACNAILYNTNTTFELAINVSKIQGVAWSSFITYYFLFIIFLTNSRKLIENPATYIVTMLAPALFVHMNYQGEMLNCCRSEFFGMTAGWKTTPWALAFFTYYTVMFIAGTSVLFIFRNRTRIKIEKTMADIMLTGAVVVFVLGSLINVIMKMMGTYLPLDANVTFLIFMGGLIYCAEKYEMLSMTGARIADKITASINEGLILLGADGEILGANSMALEIFGYGAEKSGAFPVEKIENSMRVVSGKMKEGVDDFEMKVMTPAGEEKDVLVSIRAIEKRAICIIRDITSKKKDETELAELVEELKRSNEELEKFAYVASHDLKEPLRMVASYVQMLKKKSSAKFNADEMDYINFASEGAMRMDDLISDLLEYSRVGTKGQKFTETDLSAVVDRIRDILKFRIQDKKAGIVIEGSLPVISADITQMEQLFQNLLENALKFSGKEPPVIRISSVKKGVFHEISVKDNGIGIDMQYKERIFMIFQRLHSKEEYEGTGIGLAICKKIVERHHGKMWVESEGEGKGSAFIFTLPA